MKFLLKETTANSIVDLFAAFSLSKELYPHCSSIKPLRYFAIIILHSYIMKISKYTCNAYLQSLSSSSSDPLISASLSSWLPSDSSTSSESSLRRLLLLLLVASSSSVDE